MASTQGSADPTKDIGHIPGGKEVKPALEQGEGETGEGWPSTSLGWSPEPEEDIASLVPFQAAACCRPGSPASLSATLLGEAEEHGGSPKVSGAATWTTPSPTCCHGGSRPVPQIQQVS